MRVLVTGVAGFVGRHLAAELREAGHTVIGFDHGSNSIPASGVLVLNGDIREMSNVARAVHEAKPDACVHLAGVAFVPEGWKQPEAVFSVNTIGTINLLEAFRLKQPCARVVLVTSAEIYGMPPDDRRITETDPPSPQSLYAVSKLSADLMGLLYAKRYGIPIMTARPSNHIGPGQSDRFVTSSFARQLAEMRAGKRQKVLRVGNLDSERSFMDVRDTVRAYRLLIERGRAGEAYNVAGRDRIPIRTVLDLLCEEAGLDPVRQVDETLYRPTDRSPRLETRKIEVDVGWTPQIPLRQTLHDILMDWEQRLAKDVRSIGH